MLGPNNNSTSNHMIVKIRFLFLRLGHFLHGFFNCLIFFGNTLLVLLLTKKLDKRIDFLEADYAWPLGRLSRWIAEWPWWEREGAVLVFLTRCPWLRWLVSKWMSFVYFSALGPSRDFGIGRIPEEGSMFAGTCWNHSELLFASWKFQTRKLVASWSKH